MKHTLFIKKNRELIQSISKKTTLFLFCLINLTFIKGQTPITGTITAPTNTVINSVCDLQLCGQSQNFGDGLIFYLDNVDYLNSNLTSWDILSNNFCRNIRSDISISSGIHTIYLAHHPVSGPEVKLDSITVNIVNSINPVTYTTSVSPLFGATNGEQLVTVGNLNPTETYTIDINITNNGPASNYTTSLVGITGTNVATYTFNPNYNTVYIAEVDVTSNCRAASTNPPHTFVVSTASCGISNAIIYANGVCAGDTSLIVFQANYQGLTPNTIGIVHFNFGDGSLIQTNTFTVDLSGSGNIVLPSNQAKHIYQYPGTYTGMFWLSAPGLCYSDTIIQTIVVNTSCGKLIGTVYKDVNNNCSQDGSETAISNIEVKLTQGANIYYTWTDMNGQYSFYNVTAGNYVIEIGNNSSGYSVICTNSQAHGTTINTNGVTTENFALTCNAQFDVAVTGISLMNGLFPGQVDAILPHIGLSNRSCNYSVAGQVKIVLDPCLTYDPVAGAANYGWFNPMPDAIVLVPTGDTLIWNVSDINNIGNFGYFDFPAAITTCTNAQVGDLACITLMALPSVGDANPNNNSFTFCFEIGVAYDPNFKEVSPKGLGTQGYIDANTPELRYTVHFQNTGTAPARNIYVLDSLSNNLDMGTLEVLSSSHPMQSYLLENRTIKFMFANINLPDSTHDEAHSHGYVTYKVKPKANLAPATQIKNTGYIYFDYNDPIVTNTTLNTIALPTGIKETNFDNAISLYPNPASTKLHLSVSTTIASLRVIDITGKELINVTNITSNQYILNVNSLENGTYIIEIKNNEGQKSVKKFVKISE